jgi:hypothetical protein
MEDGSFSCAQQPPASGLDPVKKYPHPLRLDLSSGPFPLGFMNARHHGALLSPMLAASVLFCR